MLPTMSVYRRGERNAEPQGERCLSCTVHLSAAEEGFEFHWDPRASTPTEASETKNVKDKLRPAPGEFSGFHRFLILVCGQSWNLRPTYIHRSNLCPQRLVLLLGQ